MTGTAMARRLARRLQDIAGARLWLLFFLIIAASLAEGIGLLSIIPLLVAALGERGQVNAFEPLFAWIRLAPTLKVTLTLFLLAFGLRILLGLWRDYLAARIEARIEVEFGSQLARALATAPFADIARRGRGEVQSLLGFDAPRSGAAAMLLVQLFRHLVMLVIAGALAAFVAPGFALVAAGAALLILLIGWMRLRRSKQVGDMISRLHAEQDAMAQQLFGAIKAASAQESGEQLAREYRARLDAVMDAQVGLDHHHAAGRALLLAIGALATAVLVWSGARILSLDLATLSAALLLFARMIQPAQAVQRESDRFFGLLPAYARLEPFLDADLSTPPMPEGAPPCRLSARDASYGHPGRRPLWSGVDFSIAKGEWLAILGASGAGKTSLIDCIAGLMEPSEGYILLDDLPVSKFPGRARQLAYVAQADLVFNDTIAANLAMGGDPSRERMLRALQTVGLDRSLDEEVSEIGGALSGGERQRLLIARALCRDPALLLLDESFSALDSPAAREIIQAIRRKHKAMMAVLITHRPETASHCDHILTLGTAGEAV